MDFRDLRARADAALGNTTPTPSLAEVRAGNQDRLLAGGIAATNTARALGRKVAHDYTLEAAVQNGQPPFPHLGNTLLSVLTCGLWLPVYWLNWRFSKRRRYQVTRRTELARQGLT